MKTVLSVLAAITMTLWIVDHLAKPAKADMLDMIQCTTSVGMGSPVFNGRCFRGEVMTGIQNDLVYCAQITVNCN